MIQAPRHFLRGAIFFVIPHASTKKIPGLSLRAPLRGVAISISEVEIAASLILLAMT